MKSIILEVLKTKFAGVEDKILDRIAEKVSSKTTQSTTEEDAKKLAEAVTFQQVLENYGDRRATEATKTAVENYEKKHGLKAGKKLKEEEEQEEEEQEEEEEEKPQKKSKKASRKDDEMPAWAKALLEQNESMKKELDEMKGEKTSSARKVQLAKMIENLPQPIKLKFERDFSRMSFQDNEDFDKWLNEDVKNDVETIQSEIKVKGSVFSTPKGGGQVKTEEVNPIVKARVEAMQKSNEGKSSAIVGGKTN